MSIVCSFLILTIYPEVKDYHLHFTEGKKEITNAILCSAPSSPSLRPQVAARTVTLRAGTSSLSPQSSRDHSRTSRECWAQVGITGWPPTWKSLQLQTRPRVRQSDTKNSPSAGTGTSGNPWAKICSSLITCGYAPSQTYSSYGFKYALLACSVMFRKSL